MNRFTVTITDKVSWTTTVDASDATDAEGKAWDLFQTADRSEQFEDDADTTVRVDEINHGAHTNINESTSS
ncbi:MAG: hypothetical protein ABL982_14975 [Vicinamibacterales bacterium]